MVVAAAQVGFLLFSSRISFPKTRQRSPVFHLTKVHQSKTFAGNY